MGYQTLLVDRAGAVATITLNRPDARNALDMVNRAASSDLAAALDVEAFSQAIAITGDEHREGVAAFLEKRPAKF